MWIKDIFTNSRPSRTRDVEEQTAADWESCKGSLVFREKLGIRRSECSFRHSKIWEIFLIADRKFQNAQ